MSATLENIERDALMLPPPERSRLAAKLWDSLSGRQGMEVVMTPALERLLNEGLENLDEAKTTGELRRQ
jgi:hypothetical protein